MRSQSLRMVRCDGCGNEVAFDHPCPVCADPLDVMIAAENEYRRRLDEAIAEDDKAWEFADAD